LMSTGKKIYQHYFTNQHQPAIFRTPTHASLVNRSQFSLILSRCGVRKDNGKTGENNIKSRYHDKSPSPSNHQLFASLTRQPQRTPYCFSRD
jgi:hypothetical protein